MRLSMQVMAVLAIIGMARLCPAEGWPKWLGPDGNGISTETGLLAAWPADGPKKLWSQNVGIGYSSPVALDGKLYFFSQEGTNDVLRAFNADDGKIIWTESYSRGDDPSYPGTRATPTIDSGRIYTHGSDGDLVCRELADGKLVWRTNVLKETHGKPIQWGSSSSPLVHEDHIYVQCGKEGDATAVCVDKKSGKITWKSEAKTVAGYTTLILIDVGPSGQLIALAGDMVYAMDPKTGKTIWSEPWKVDYDVNASTPVFGKSHLFITATRKVGSMMIQVTPTGAKKEWEKADISSKFQPPILDGDTLYANSNGIIKAVSWPDGKLLWAVKDRNLNLGAGGSIVRIGDKIITMSERGKLSLASANPKECKLISQVQLFDYAQVWSTPLIYRGKLYCKGENELVCLDIGAEKK